MLPVLVVTAIKPSRADQGPSASFCHSIHVATFKRVATKAKRVIRMVLPH